jgi:2-polyprenyl-3-methyl-5-hydroxy-6-metoxy-1,4-benzoquinol methylase
MKIESYDNPMSAIASTQEYIIDLEKNEGDWLLEAGCGSLSRINLPEGFRIAGIDISEKQLNRNASIEKKICGDIQTFELEKNKFKLCICWDVLEHLKSPEKALNNLMNSLEIGGTIILAMPNIRSLKGLITKFSPHWFHIFYYKKILGIANAGKDDTAPFETFLNEITSPDSVKKILESQGFSIKKLIFRDAMVYRLKISHKSLWCFYYIASNVLSTLTGGKYGGMNNSDYIIIATKDK